MFHFPRLTRPFHQTLRTRLIYGAILTSLFASAPSQATLRNWGGTLHRASVTDGTGATAPLAVSCTLGSDFSTICTANSPESFTYTSYGRNGTPVGTENDREFLRETSTTAYYRNFIGLETVPEPRTARYIISFPVDVPAGYQIRLHGAAFEFETEMTSSWSREFNLAVTLGVRASGMSNQTNYSADILVPGQSPSSLRVIFADGQTRSYLNQVDRTAFTVRSGRNGDFVNGTHCGGRQEIHAQLDMTASFGSFPTVSFTRAIQSYYKTTNTEFTYDPRVDAFTATAAPVTFEFVPCAPGTPSAAEAIRMMGAPAAAPRINPPPANRPPVAPGIIDTTPGIVINPNLRGVK
jgi:hypothetical protein